MDKYSIVKINHAKLIIATKPFSESLFTSELSNLKKKFQNILICSVLSNLEILKYNLTQEGDICEQNSVEFLHLSIADESIPVFEDFKILVNTLFEKTKTCDAIIIHCKHGIGRSGMIAVGILMSFGYNMEEACKLTSIKRGYDVPQSKSQFKLLSYYRESLNL